VLLDRRRVKFWQKWIFGIMAVLMAGFLVMIPISKASGCGGQTQVSDALQKDLATYQAAVKKDPSNVDMWKNLGDAYASMSAQGGQSATLTATQTADLGKAAAAYRSAIDLLANQKGTAAKTQRSDLLLGLGQMYDTLGEYQKEVTVYGELTGLQPKNADYFFALGNAASKAGDTTNALLAFQRFVDLAPNDPNAAGVKAWIKQNAPKPTPAPTSTKGTGQ
jgi:tetratricopeptide (TPR) repeat protein